MTDDLMVKRLEKSIAMVRDSKVRHISRPGVVLHIREVDPEGLIDGTPKALCAASFGFPKWIPIGELERAE